ncbi:MAG: DUF433 domain-containing protein [Planctomycetia bacterium]|nr:DUF433 domain-containing protein [Planctomycetia bacterium]
MITPSPLGPGVLTFLQLMELHFVNLFRRQGVLLHVIRRAARKAARQFHTSFPFCVKRFDTDGSTVFATLQHEETGKELVQDLARGQYVFQKILRPFFHKLDYGQTEIGESIVRYWPLEKRGRVVLDPERHFGRPIDFESGVPTRAIYLALKANKDRRKVADWLGVPLAAVDAAAQFEETLCA